MHKQTLGSTIYSGLQKGLHVGQKAVEYTALAKGLYETGKTLFSVDETGSRSGTDGCGLAINLD